MSTRLHHLSETLAAALGDALVDSRLALGELTITVAPGRWLDVAYSLRDQYGFEQLIDLCGVDYSTYGDGRWKGQRYCVVTHLLSVQHNLRLRVKVFAAEDAMPQVDSVVDVWNVANWFERETFDLYGILFAGHPDLRRLLTDYGFIGHPFRKDFPVNGNVEMRYDEQKKRVVYEPSQHVLRNNVPRIVRSENYGDTEIHG
jgi:NADH-quinone oxidoreductase subunit C